MRERERALVLRIRLDIGHLCFQQSIGGERRSKAERDREIRAMRTRRARREGDGRKERLRPLRSRLTASASAAIKCSSQTRTMQMNRKRQPTR